MPPSKELHAGAVINHELHADTKNFSNFAKMYGISVTAGVLVHFPRYYYSQKTHQEGLLSNNDRTLMLRHDSIHGQHILDVADAP